LGSALLVRRGPRGEHLLGLLRELHVRELCPDCFEFDSERHYCIWKLREANDRRKLAAQRRRLAAEAVDSYVRGAKMERSKR
jgi:hypothetical protein